MKCFTCNQGEYVRTTISYTAELPSGPDVIVNGVEVDKCDSCGEIIYDGEASRKIEKGIESIFPGYFL